MSEKDQIVVLADVSISMSARDGGSREGKTRFALLREALQSLPSGVKIVAFSDEAHVTTVEAIRLEEGCTALHKAIQLAATFQPVRTVIVSDGEPDSEDEARKAVEELTGIVRRWSTAGIRGTLARQSSWSRWRGRAPAGSTRRETRSTCGSSFRQ